MARRRTVQRLAALRPRGDGALAARRVRGGLLGGAAGVWLDDAVVRGGAARLFAIQSAWSYERMLGIGFGHADRAAAAAAASPGAVRAALARQSRFFNAHPYVTAHRGGAAAARPSWTARPPERIERLRAALCGPLGVAGRPADLGGVAPLLRRRGLLLVAVGAGGVGRGRRSSCCSTSCTWGCASGGCAPDGGRGCGSSARSRIPFLQRGLEVVGPLAALAVGAALPALLVWFVRGAGLPVPWSVAREAAGAAVAGAAVFAAAVHRLGTRATALSAAILVLGVVVGAGVLWR